MDYKSFQKAITDRLGSQFGVSVLIATVYLHWELIFILADTTRSIDEKIDCVSDWTFPFWFEVGLIILIIVMFQLGNLFAKFIGAYTNDVIWGWILKGIGRKTKYVDRAVHKAATDSLAEMSTIIENYSKTISDMDAKNANQTLLITEAQTTRDAANKLVKSNKLKHDRTTEKLRDEKEALFMDLEAERGKSGELAQAVQHLAMITLFIKNGDHTKELKAVDNALLHLDASNSTFGNETASKLRNMYKS